MSRRMLSSMFLTAALVLGTVPVAAPGAAHSSQIGSEPAAGAVLDRMPRVVRVDFDSPLMDVGAAMVVRSRDGRTVSVGAPRVGRSAIRMAVDPTAPPGEYTVAYRVVSQDGHIVEATYAFSISGPSPAGITATPSPPAPSAAPLPTPSSAADDDGTSPLSWVLLGVIVTLTIAAAGAIALRG